ncbi:hypothetical protein D3C75_1315140 [compost metagenome]
MGGHQKHLCDIVRIDNPDVTWLQSHFSGIDNQQTLRVHLADSRHFSFRRAATIQHYPIPFWRSGAHFCKQWPDTVVAHHTVANTQ